mgnify:CR=1 FL=1
MGPLEGVEHEAHSFSLIDERPHRLGGDTGGGDEDRGGRTAEDRAVIHTRQQDQRRRGIADGDGDWDHDRFVICYGDNFAVCTSFV